MKFTAAAFIALSAASVVACSSSGDDDDMVMNTPGTGGTAPAVTGGAGPAGNGGAPMVTAGAGGSPGAVAGAGGTVPMAGAGGATMPADPDAGMGPDDEPMGMWSDDGPGEWPLVADIAKDCKIDGSLLAMQSFSEFAIFRYGHLCFTTNINDGASSLFSATKTLGGTFSGVAAYETRDIPSTGPGTGSPKDTDKVYDWVPTAGSNVNREALLAHIMAMVGHNLDLSYGNKSYSYDTVGTTEINNMIAVTEKAISQDSARLGTSAVQFTQKFLFDKLGMSDSSWSGGAIATGWTGSMADMGKLGTLLAHGGWFNGERVLAEEWVYRMSHPAFEDANTSYGELAWLNHRGNATGIGGDIASGSNGPDGDPCAPAAFWTSYPHPPSEAMDCRATVAGASCTQKYDVGVFSAQGLGGQFVVMHPGLDLVLVAKNFSNQNGPTGMWDKVRPALVALDPTYMGDEAAFCKAYGAGDYAPDLMEKRHP